MSQISAVILRSVLVAIVCGAADGIAPAQQIEVGSRVPISVPGSGWHNWTVIEADPNDPRRLMACGDRWSPATNALSGFVYISNDGGRSWKLTLEDTHSPWVSEEACAFGPDARAYFFAGASKMVSGMTNHAQGTMWLYASVDGGTTWSTMLTRGWVDHGAMVVDHSSGPYRNRMYIFFNGSPVRGRDDVRRNEMQLLYSDDEGKTLKGPVSPPTASGFRYTGTYPTTARVLEDGTAIAVMYARRQATAPSVSSEAPSTTYSVDVARTIDGGKTLEAPVTVGIRQESSNGRSCGGTPVMAADPTTRGAPIYVIYSDGTAGTCEVVIAKSRDNGVTWSRPSHVVDPADPIADKRYPTVGVNRNGTVGVAWFDGDAACWRFSASLDEGTSFLPSVPLSGCPAKRAGGMQFLQHYLWSVAFVDPGRLPGVAGTPPGNLLTGFTIRSGTGAVWKTSMAVTPDGVFHPVFMENLEGAGQIWTSAVTVNRLPHGPAPLPTLSGLEDVSDHVSFEFENNQFDEATGTLSVDIHVINKGDAVIGGPLRLQVTRVRSDVGAIEVENADNAARREGALWDLSDVLQGQTLAPHTVSRGRRRLVFRLSDIRPPGGPYIDMVILQGAMFGHILSKK